MKKIVGVGREKRKERSRLLLLLFLIFAEAVAGLSLLVLTDAGGGWIFVCLPILQTATALLLLGNSSAEEGKGKQESAPRENTCDGREKTKKYEKKERVKKSAARRTASSENGYTFGSLLPFPLPGRCFYAGTLAAAAVMLSAPFRLLIDKLLAKAGFHSLLPLSYMSGAAMAGIVLLILFPILSELLHRHLLEERVSEAFSGAAVPLMGLFYACALPLLNGILPGLIIGMALSMIKRRTGSYFLTYGSSLVIHVFSVFYQYLLLSDFSGGSAMPYSDIAGLGCIFAVTALSAVAIAESVMKKRRPRAIEVFCGILIFVLLIAGGLMLVSL